MDFNAGIRSVPRRQRRGDSPQVRLARLRRQTRHRICLRVCPTTSIAAAETAHCRPAGRGRGGCFDGAARIRSEIVPRAAGCVVVVVA